MKKVKVALAALTFICLNSSVMAEQIREIAQTTNPMDCSNMGPDMQQFAGQLNATNKKMFCGQFNDSQRASAMQMASQQNSSGAMMMSPDQAVQKVATDNNMMPSAKTPTGCPVK
jgi:hypothetical protein